MKKMITFFSSNIGSFVITFLVIFVLFSLKRQFGIQDTISSTLVVAVIAIIVSEVIRNVCKRALLNEEVVSKQAILDDIEKNKKK